MATDKKVTRVEPKPQTTISAGSSQTAPQAGSPQTSLQTASPAKGSQTKRSGNQPTTKNRIKLSFETTIPDRNRAIALVLWMIAIGLEVAVIFRLLQFDPPNTVLIIGLIACIGALSTTGILLWYSANQLDPAPKHEKLRYFVQNYLGLVFALLAFVPIIIVIMLNKNTSRQQKIILAALTTMTLAPLAFLGISTGIPSIDTPAQQRQVVVTLMGVDEVFWTTNGSKLHLYDDCAYINTAKTSEIFVGTVAAAYSVRELSEICKPCYSRASKASPIETDPGEADLGEVGLSEVD
ncbi:MAG: hypothetical protein LBU61_06335 [Coriobacteriales bacterium]|jgi:NADH:ubiquinone oxidoreductase subunit 6 (subunit J)|nr:hypothetical protein [Coriobacteriales bacterium]